MGEAQLDALADVPPSPQRWRAVLAGIWTDYRLIVSITAIYGVAAPLGLWAAGLLEHYHRPAFLLGWLPLTVAGGALLVAVARRREQEWLNPARLAAMATVWLCLPIGFESFVGIKRALIEVLPLRCDALFVILDAWLHGGRAPWEWLMAIGTPGVISFIQACYFLWYPIQAAVLYYFVWVPSPLGRRFLLTYLLNWIVLGNLAAAALFSVGPCYYAQFVGGPDPYANLWPQLERTAAASLALQRALASGGVMDTGIAAMPSLHVAHAVLIAIALWHATSVWAIRVAAIAFAVCIQIGSVLLGWHYAIDGYVAAIGTWGLWIVAGRWQKASTTA